MNDTLASRLYLDLVVVGGVALAVLLLDVAVTALPVLSWLRLPLGLALLSLLPGYAFVAAALPRTERQVDWNGTDRSAGGRTLETSERLLLSFVVSLSILGIVAIGALRVGVALDAVTLPALAVVTLLSAAIAARRRSAAPGGNYPDLYAAVGRLREVVRTELRTETALGTGITVAVVLTVLVAIAGVGALAQQQPPTEGNSEYALLTENESGDLTAAGYPSTLTAGEPESLTVQIANHEGEPVNYTVAVRLERLISDGDSRQIIATRPIDQYSVQLSPGESTTVQRSVTPSTTGENLRLTYLFYTSSPPENPSRETADDALHLWVTVER